MLDLSSLNDNPAVRRRKQLLWQRRHHKMLFSVFKCFYRNCCVFYVCWLFFFVRSSIHLCASMHAFLVRDRNNEHDTPSNVLHECLCANNQEATYLYALPCHITAVYCSHLRGYPPAFISEAVSRKYYI